MKRPYAQHRGRTPNAGAVHTMGRALIAGRCQRAMQGRPCSRLVKGRAQLQSRAVRSMQGRTISAKMIAVLTRCSSIVFEQT